VIRTLLSGLLLAAMLGFAPPGDARAEAPERCAPPPGPIVYRIIHEGDEVGWLEISIQTNGAETAIYTAIDIGITLAYVIPVLDYRHDSTEIWRDGAFERFDGMTVDNGREHVVSILSEGTGLRLLKAGDPPAIFDAALLSWTVWCEAALKAGRLLNPLKGRTKDFTAKFAGEETTTLEEVSVSGRRYDVEFHTPDGADVRSGTVWYGEDGIVAALTFPTKRDTQASLVRSAPGG
jgi:hypothetical protein